ncbi:hypothetical protein HDE_13121 [Halotydeus destructor]|nr:hypothetical protein HDE_13121 [Halotydeus destructor]
MGTLTLIWFALITFPAGQCNETARQSLTDLVRPFGRQTEIGLCTFSTNEGNLVRIACQGSKDIFCCGFKGNEKCCSLDEFVDSHALSFMAIRIMVAICIALFVAILSCSCYIGLQVSGVRSEEAAREEMYKIRKFKRYK